MKYWSITRKIRVIFEVQRSTVEIAHVWGPIIAEAQKAEDASAKRSMASWCPGLEQANLVLS